ncbi:MAG TPA: DinB family protein [Chitinophagaceae bacterium]|nr:DinB family protein [Chitinophagaceae bacterium]
MKKLARPAETEYALYYHSFLQSLEEDCHVLNTLKQQMLDIEKTLLNLPETSLQFSYAPGKWTIRDILQHLIDCERVFIYRAMRFSRKDTTPLPFFDENEFALQANANVKPIRKLIKEYKTTRLASLAFFSNLTTAQWKLKGIAGSTPTSVRACAWILCGHERHHWKVIQEKYLSILSS